VTKVLVILCFCLGGHSTNTFDAIRSGVHFPYTVQHSIELFGVLVPLAKPGAEVEVCQVVAENEEPNGNLKTQGKIKSKYWIAYFQ
jgi:hypothetical protein